jgi:hypothetical protein
MSASRLQGRVRRWPALLVLLALVVAAGVVQHQRDQRVTRPQPVLVSQLQPVAAGPGTLSSTWYCAAGTATGTATGLAEQTVVVQNASGRALGGHIEAITDSGKTAARTFRVPARDHLDIRVSDLIVAPYASAVVEMAGGEVAVAHVLSGPTGTTTAACSTTPSADWYVPSGTTAPGTRQLLALFNPFPSDAIATVTFATDAGSRAPDSYDGVVIPGGQVTVLDVGAVVTLRTQLATTVAVREGRLIVDQLQSADGTNGTVKGLAVTPAAPGASPRWWFADGPATAGAKTMVAVQNPGTSPVKVSLSLRLDANGTVSPFETTVAPLGYSLIDVTGDGRVPVGVGFTAVARSAGAQPIVVDRVVQAAAPAVPSGFDVTLGSPAVASRWLIPAGVLPSASQATVIVTNPSSTQVVQVGLSTVAAGQAVAVTGIARTETIAAGRRAGFVVPTGAGVAESSLQVVSNRPVVVEERLGFTAGGQASPLAVPVAPTATLSWSGRF